MPEHVVTHRGVTRREFLKTGGAIVVSFGIPASVASVTAPKAGAAWPAPPDAAALDSWLRIAADGSVTASVGKIDAGMGIGTAFAQIVAEELDVPIERVTIVMGDTATTVDQRGTGSSNGIVEGGAALRKAAAEGRAALVALAARRLEVPAEALRTRGGAVYVAAEPTKQAAYGELIGGRRFDVQVSEKPMLKDPRDYTVVGQPIPRFDIPPKVAGTYRYVGDLRVEGMLHGRVIRPPRAGAKLVAVDDAQGIAGLVKVVRHGDFLGVVCEREEQAVAAARDLRAKWSDPAPLYWDGYDALYEHLRSERPKASKEDKGRGDVEKAFAAAARVVEARYEYPFQSHASMGPACAVADVRDGGAVIWFGGQKPYPIRRALAELLKLPAEKVRVTWMPGPGSYGNERRRRLRCRRRAPFPGGGASGALAVHEERRHRLGSEGTAGRFSHARGARCVQFGGRVGLRGARLLGAVASLGNRRGGRFARGPAHGHEAEGRGLAAVLVGVV
jgi:CO/xanthine dehydrogenase Mo-binding subunit